jgi:peptidoglycan/LPS O-acetylase OafA/YrhL
MQMAEHANPMNGMKTIDYRRDIDGLRGIAVLSVVLYHAGVPFLGGGYVGVDVFFVISGYLISSHIYRDLLQGTFSIRSFYERRAKRILPALLAVVSVFTCLGAILLAPRELEVLCAQSISALTSVSNILFWVRTSYFGPHADLKPMLMTWSLGVEEQFYLLFPLLVGWIWVLGRRKLLLSLAALSVVSFAVSVFQVSFYPSASFFLLTSRWWELGSGTILGIYEAGRTKEAGAGLIDWRREVFGVLGIIGVLAGVLLYNSTTLFPGVAALLPVAASLMLLSSKESWVNRNILSFKILVAVGLVSYSLYLWHWPILSLAQYCSGDALAAVPKGWLVALAFAVATFSYFFVEQPCRRMRRTSRTLKRYALASVLCSIPACILLAGRGLPSRYPVAAEIEQEAHSPPIASCTAQDGQSSPVTSGGCSSIKGHPTIAIMGDSHAASLNRYLQSALESRDLSVAQFTKSSCPQLDFVAPGGAERENCVRFNHNSIGHVIKDPNIKTVVLAGYWLALFPPFMEQGRYVAEGQKASNLSVEDSWRNLGAGLNDVVARLHAGGKRVYVVIDSPSLGFDPLLLTLSDAIVTRRAIKKLLWNGDSSGLIPHSEEPNNIRLEGLLRQVAASHHAQIIDLYGTLCTGSTCRYALNGRPLYEDPHHLTRLGAEFAIGDSAASLADEQIRDAGLLPGSLSSCGRRVRTHLIGARARPRLSSLCRDRDSYLRARGRLYKTQPSDTTVPSL